MKKIITFLFALVPLMGYAQYDNEWIQKSKNLITNARPYLNGYCFAPTENLVYAHEFILEDDIDNLDPNRRLLRDSLVYTIPTTRKAKMFGLIVATVNPNAVYKEDCQELQLNFNSKICDAYRTINEEDFTGIVKQAVLTAKFVHNTQIGYTQNETTLYRGGEYELIGDNNAGTGHTAKLTVLADPICTIEPLENNESSYTINNTCAFSVKIGSGYPYADRLKDYQKGEMVATITDAEGNLVYTETHKLDASADSLKMEFFKGNDQKIYLTSTKYTLRLSGPLLKEDLVITKEVSANFYRLKNAIDEAQALADTINSNPLYASLAKYAEDLVSAISNVTPCLEYSVHEQDKIDKAAESLAKLVDETNDAMSRVSSVDAVTTNGTTTTVKRIINGKVIITTKDHNYDVQGIEASLP